MRIIRPDLSSAHKECEYAVVEHTSVFVEVEPVFCKDKFILGKDDLFTFMCYCNMFHKYCID